MNINGYSFIKAVPVWEKDSQRVMNRTLVFLARINQSDDCRLALAGSTSFTVFVNGTLIAHGPARAAHGFYRVDEYELAPHLVNTQNTVEIRISGYNINSFAYLDQPSFLCAEITSHGNVIAHTGAPSVGFSAYGMDEKIRKVHRFSYQRPFTENYRLGECSFDYSKKSSVALEECDSKTFICRDLPYGEYQRLLPTRALGRGRVGYSEKDGYFADRAITRITEHYRGFYEHELEFRSYVEVGKMDFSPRRDGDEPLDDILLEKDSYIDLDMGVNHTGLVSLDVEAMDDCELYVTFDEILVDGNVNCFRFETTGVISLLMKKGYHKLTSAEPYDMRYVRIIAKGGRVRVKHFSLIEIAYPKSLINAKFVSDDAVMRKIYDAAIETFRANTVDIYMDCPSRERSGYLCDSFFTSRVERVLTGASRVEKQFLSNFIMPGQHPALPQGMLPMCYPADVVNGLYIPNWAMWYVIELDEYVGRTGDYALANDAKEQIYSLARYFEGFENELGLLEKLRGWVFVEWSRCNDLVQDVSFPSNMLYSRFLDCIARLYGDENMAKKSVAVKSTVNGMAMTESGFYCDNAIRGTDGKLTLSGERTETCQYYAFFTDVATPETHPELWRVLVNDFGAQRAETGKFPEIYPSAPFIGNYLRLDLLDRYGYHDKLYADIRGYFEYMADRTGTLWEHAGVQASCNHGFASHVIYWMRSMGLVK